MSGTGKLLQLVKAFTQLAFTRAELHTSAALCKKIKRAPHAAHELPKHLNLSHGRLVGRGLRLDKPVAGYTHEPIKPLKTGGRGTDGRIEIRRIGGGKPVVWHMADLVRITEQESDPKIEMVREVIEEQIRSAYLALVAGGEKKRWIIATENMKVGDIIKSTRALPVMPVQAQLGDCHPVGALPIGTQICCIERFPHHGSKVANGAGTSCQIIKKVGDMVTVKMPSKREMVINEKCLCVVGRCSNTERNKRNLGKAGAARWLGIRPKSGLWLRKTGLAGRKIKPIRKPREYYSEDKSKLEKLTFTVKEAAFDKCSPLVN